MRGGGFAEESSNIPTDLFGIGLASEEEWL